MGATFEKIMKIGRKKCFRRWWVKMEAKDVRLKIFINNSETPLIKHFFR